jgi:hypothetical protein
VLMTKFDKSKKPYYPIYYFRTSDFDSFRIKLRYELLLSC